jgi:hypothetical protein
MRALLDFLADWFRDARNNTGMPEVTNLAMVAAESTSPPSRAAVQLRAG